MRTTILVQDAHNWKKIVIFVGMPDGQTIRLISFQFLLALCMLYIDVFEAKIGLLLYYFFIFVITKYFANKACLNLKN